MTRLAVLWTRGSRAHFSSNSIFLYSIFSVDRKLLYIANELCCELCCVLYIILPSYLFHLYDFLRVCTCIADRPSFFFSLIVLFIVPISNSFSNSIGLHFAVLYGATLVVNKSCKNNSYTYLLRPRLTSRSTSISFSYPVCTCNTLLSSFRRNSFPVSSYCACTHPKPCGINFLFS